MLQQLYSVPSFTMLELLLQVNNANRDHQAIFQAVSHVLCHENLLYQVCDGPFTHAILLLACRASNAFAHGSAADRFFLTMQFTMLVACSMTRIGAVLLSLRSCMPFLLTWGLWSVLLTTCLRW